MRQNKHQDLVLSIPLVILRLFHSFYILHITDIVLTVRFYIILPYLTGQLKIKDTGRTGKKAEADKELIAGL